MISGFILILVMIANVTALKAGMIHHGYDHFKRYFKNSQVDSVRVGSFVQWWCQAARSVFPSVISGYTTLFNSSTWHLHISRMVSLSLDFPVGITLMAIRNLSVVEGQDPSSNACSACLSPSISVSSTNFPTTTAISPTVIWVQTPGRALKQTLIEPVRSLSVNEPDMLEFLLGVISPCQTREVISPCKSKASPRGSFQ